MITTIADRKPGSDQLSSVMTVSADGQPYRSIVETRPGFRVADASHKDECVSALDLGLKPLGSHVTLVALHESQIEDCPGDLVKACALRGNVAEKRRNEFLLGRAAARLALMDVGLPNPSQVMQRAGRDPDWPAGIVGSITHCSPWAVAAVASSSYVKALGIDLECTSSVPEKEIVSTVCRPSELRWVFEGQQSQLRTAMLFSAKESVYKALYPRCQKFFDFCDVELTWIQQQGRFRGVLLTELNEEFSPGFCFEVHCQQKAPFVFTYVKINAPASEQSSEQDFDPTGERLDGVPEL